MESFTYFNPTRIIFGKNTVSKIGRNAFLYGKKALVVYGRESIKKNGVYDIVTKSLEENNIEYVEHSGVKPNPVLSHVKEGIKKFKDEKCDMIIAVGGGSVIDESKAISAGVMYSGDVWDFFIDKAKIEDTVPLLVVLTIPATGSESNSGCVITNEETKQKYSAHSPFLFPKLSILDPSTTFSLPKEQTAYGMVDVIAHVLEGYLTTKDKKCITTDNYVYAVIKSAIKSAKGIFENPDDYDYRASFMWSATLGLNNMQGVGYKGVEWVNHIIEHSLSALYDIPHGLGLSIVLSGYFKYLLKRNKTDRIIELGKNIFFIEEPEKIITEFEKLFRDMGLKTRISENNIPESDFEKISENACELGNLWGWSYKKEDVIEILEYQK